MGGVRPWPLSISGGRGNSFLHLLLVEENGFSLKHYFGEFSQSLQGFQLLSSTGFGVLFERVGSFFSHRLSPIS